MTWLVFLGVIITASCFHEPWRDEYQALLLSNASSSFADVVWRARYEGHPSLWYLILYLIPDTGYQVAIAKAIAVAIMAGVGWLVAFRAPFPLTIKAGLLFSYFFCYEYAAFFRQYGIAVLLFLGAIALLRMDHGRWRVAAAIPMSILPFTQIYGALLSLGLFATLAFIQWRGRPVMPRRAALVGAGLYMVAFAVAIWDVIPAADGNFYGSWSVEGSKLWYAATIPARAFLPFPATGPWNWDDTLVAGLAAKAGPVGAQWLLALVSAALVIGAARTLRNSRGAQVLFLCSCLFILSFCAVRFHGGLRHQGMIFIAYIGALWWARTDRCGPVGRPHPGMHFFLPTILVVQVAAGLTMVVADVVHPFSGSVGTAGFLRDSGRSENPIYAACEDLAISVAGALDRPVYYPIIHREATYMDWNKGRSWGITEEEHLEEFDNMVSGAPALLYLCTEPLTEEQMARHKLLLIHQDPPTIRADESFMLYRCQP